jgi:hypothetical protein
VTTPALNIPVRATGLDEFKNQMTQTSALAGSALRVVTSQVIKMNAGFLASQGAAGAATIAFGGLLGVLGPIMLGITAISDAFKLMGYATDLAKAKIAEYNAIADKASTVSSDFYQRITKSAATAKLSVDDLTTAFHTLNAATADKLGGSDLQNRIDELKKAGNLAGNTGVGSLASANNTEEKFRAIVSLIDQAMQKGERLAALDIADKAFGPQITNALRADSGYLDQMLQRADAINKSEIISPEEIGRAVELQQRMEAAQQVLAEKWKPIQDDLASLGMNYEASWVSITEYLASAVGYATDLYKALHQVPDWFAHGIGGASIWKSITDATTTPDSRKASEDALGISSDPKEVGMVSANEKLRAALQNHQNVIRAQQEATTVQSAVRGDTSKNPTDTTGKDEDGVDRAINSLNKHIQQQEADTKAIGLGDAALAKFRATAQETAAVQANGGKETEEQAAKFKTLEDRAGAAAEALARAKINSEISDGRQTALLSPEDAAVAQKLSGVYGGDVPRALASSEAAALKFNAALKGVSGTIENSMTTNLANMLNGTVSVQNGFRLMARSIVGDLEQMVIKMAIVQPLMGGMQSAFSGLFGSSSALPLPGAGNFIGPVAKADGGIISGPGTGRSDSIPARVSNGEFIVNADATSKHRALLESINSGVPRFADGGMVGGKGSPMPVIHGPTSNIAPTINVTVQGSPGASSQDHAAMGAAVATAAGAHIQKMIGDEIRTQMRPGGVLRR